MAMTRVGAFLERGHSLACGAPGEVHTIERFRFDDNSPVRSPTPAPALVPKAAAVPSGSPPTRVSNQDATKPGRDEARPYRTIWPSFTLALRQRRAIKQAPLRSEPARPDARRKLLVGSKSFFTHRDPTGFSGADAGPIAVNHPAPTVLGHFLGLASTVRDQAEPGFFAFPVCRAGSQTGASELGSPDGPGDDEFPLCRVHLAQGNATMRRHDRWGIHGSLAGR